MRSLLSRPKGPGLEDRLVALDSIVELGRERLDPAEVDAARSVLDRASERMGLGAEFTVVALAGSTGSGKSSLFNALSGTDLSQVGVRRPTTATAHAAVWGNGSSSRLLDWLGVPRRHHQDDPELNGLVLLDLPDHDSTQVEHRLEVDRLAGLVDLFVWVVDPQKYADAALHDGYLRPLASHAAVTLIVLNQIDKLQEAERRRCAADMARLVRADGLRDVKVMTTSARTGEGIEGLRDAIVERVRQERAAVERLSADLDLVVERIAPLCEGKTGGMSKGDQERLTEALAAAARIDAVTGAVAKSYRRDAALAMGWPFTRWLRRLRPDPLARLHLRRDASGGRTSLPPASPSQRAEVESAIRTVATRAAEGLPPPWPDLVRNRAAASTQEISDDLDRAVATTDLGDAIRPRWWTVGAALQTLLATAAVVGFLWLTILFVFEWFQIPRPPTPEIENFPWPTLLLFGGLLAGFLIAAVFGQLARVGAARRRKRAATKLRQQVAEVAVAQVLTPIEAELSARSQLCEALQRMRR